VTRGIKFSGLICKTTPSSRLLLHTRECGRSFLTRILTGPLSVASYHTQGNPEDLLWDPHGLISYVGGVARVAQWLERRAQRFDDPCVGSSNPIVGRVCRSFG
jgi:hypothetical protein